MRKRLSLLLVLFLGGIVIMTGCQENKNSRQWIENKVSAVSRVYPTEDLFDLFKEFPEGFEIRSRIRYDRTSKASYSQEIELIGAASTKTITGTVKNVKSEADPYREMILLESNVTYTEAGLTFSNPDVSAKDMKLNGFLFQKWTLDKETLSQLQLSEKSYDRDTGDASIEYIVQNKTVNDYFNINKSSEVKMHIGARSATLLGKYYSYAFTFHSGDLYYSEAVVSTENGGGRYGKQ
ncbi:hypothetical protein ACVRZS_00770 [Streptococcus ferus]|uniref:Lipoprotein n=1 Tax=Streptococcus ferus TaxID=1345 RepID=A0A2X3VHH2_9STRE|nr:lipoprotein [Streptococcus ferus]